MDRPSRRTVSFVMSMTLLALAWISLPIPTASAQESPDNAVLCDRVAALTEDGYPRQALALLDAAELRRATASSGTETDFSTESALCSTEREDASTSIKDARDSAIEAANALDPSGELDASEATEQDEEAKEKAQEAREKAEEALEQDRDNAAAQRTLEAATKQLADAKAKEEKTTPQRLSDAWTSFSKTVVSPLGDILIPFLAVFGALLVLARLLVLLPWSWPGVNRDPPWRAAMLGVGVLGVATSSLLLTVGLAATRPTGLSVAGWVWYGMAVLLALVGGLLLVWLAPGNALPRVVVTALLGLGAASLIIWMASSTLEAVNDARHDLLIAGGSVLGLLGVLLIASWLATRLRLQVEVSGSDGKPLPSDTGHIVALLNELGVEPPKGLEVPRGTDVTALEGAMATLPDNAVVKTIKGLLTSLAGVSPWRAVVEKSSDDLLSVAMTRNGRSAGSAVIDRSALGLGGKEKPETSDGVADGKESTNKGKKADAARSPDLHRMAAAFILATLAHEHKQLNEGLADATDWRSIGLHYIATTDLVRASEREEQQAMLGRALNLDPNNGLAQLSYRHAVDRFSTDAETLRGYRDWLDTVQTSDPAGSLSLRAGYTRATIAVNALFADRKQGSSRPTLTDIARAKDAISKVDSSAADGASSQTLAKRIASASLALHILQEDLEQQSPSWNGEVPPPALTFSAEVPQSASNDAKAVTPVAAYNLACYFASRFDWTPPKLTGKQERQWHDLKEQRQISYDREAVRLLRQAVPIPAIRDWMTKDPQLAGFRERAPYRQEFLEPARTGFFDLAPVAPYAEALKEAGHRTPGTLAALNPNALITTVPAARPAREAIVELASLHESMSGDLKPWAIEVLHELVSRDLASRMKLALDAEQRTAAANSIAEAVVRRCRPHQGDDLDANSLRNWMDTISRSWTAGS